MKSQALALALLCLLAPAAHGSRSLQQLVDTSVIPNFSGPQLPIINTANGGGTQNVPAQAPAPSAAQASPPPPPVPAATLTPPAPAPSPPPPTATPTPNPPAPAPQMSQPPAPVPTAQPPAPVPAAQPPAPVATTTPPAPAPAPKETTATPAPAPAPVPVPAPQPPPQCGVKPQCRLFVEDMLCCGNGGAISSQQSLVYQLQCTHPVNYSPKCARVNGPANQTAFSQFQPAGWSASHTVQVNFLQQFTGAASIDVEGPRTDAVLSADCGLYITPCLLNDTLVTKVDPVQGMSFSVLDPADFLDVSNDLNGDLGNLDTLVFPSLVAPTTCQQQSVPALNATFYSSGWVNYTGGVQNTCNATALQEALAPSTAPVAVSG